MIAITDSISIDEREIQEREQKKESGEESE